MYYTIILYIQYYIPHECVGQENNRESAFISYIYINIADALLFWVKVMRRLMANFFATARTFRATFIVVAVMFSQRDIAFVLCNGVSGERRQRRGQRKEYIEPTLIAYISETDATGL